MKNVFPKKKFPPLLNDEIHLWSVSLNLSDSTIKRYSSFLSREEEKKARFFKFEREQNRYRISQGVLRQLLSSYLNKSPQTIRIGRHKKGKPFSFDNPSMYFNMSGSGNICVFAFSRDGEVGIDIEQIRELPDIDELIRKNLTPKEIIYTLKTPGNKLKRFFQFWTFKEAYLKATGEGMRLTPDNLEFSMEGGKMKLLGVKGIFEAEDWFFTGFSPVKGYIGALAYNEDEVEIKNLRF
ncbi:MAG: 4'-phosphopantetheinyl transferase superfamily protein [Bacteroidota bacterium]